ncbi:aminotransferase class V-fold PLP-dependent enzyme [Streptacidiphilus jiangxiensis]|uniref:Selenocysteine lyase/Cysteine desulfurase n=1 Tax=Streptacidiphilus jiangxiensis TaxID=235985 RepID=A0A1H7S2G8_STRJI|nr:aminotransferase class V-fold PLP-dependent enzyme [Streptacidiphilus jiangxiensis]SEL65757.1 Selenocysteine lyase/Cysteine desulfurase [Streptacidiphilus jiangxiensis]
MNVQRYLAQFQEPAGYLDFGRFGPISAVAAEALGDAVGLMAGHGWDALEALDAATVRAARSAGRLLGAREEEVAFVGSTSHGMFAAAFALVGPQGGGARRGSVLVGRRDFPAAVYPWLRAEEHGGLTVRLLDGPATVDAVRERLDPDVRAVCVCAVDGVTGFRAPLAELKELIGPDRVLVVDAVQALGAVPVEAEAADVLACGGQKWLRAGWGAALLLVRERVRERLRPGLGGWAGVVDPLGGFDHPRPSLPGARAHTLTNPDGPAVAALGAGLRLVQEVGVERINALIEEVLGELGETARALGLRWDRGRIGDGPGSGFARIAMPGVDPAALHVALGDVGLTTTLRGEWIRLSPHASSTTRSPDAAARLRAAVLAIGQRSTRTPLRTG